MINSFGGPLFKSPHFIRTQKKLGHFLDIAVPHGDGIIWTVPGGPG